MRIIEIAEELPTKVGKSKNDGKDEDETEDHEKEIRGLADVEMRGWKTNFCHISFICKSSHPLIRSSSSTSSAISITFAFSSVL